MNAIIGAITTAALNWLKELFLGLLRVFIKTKQNEAENRENRERLEESKTDEEQQQATNELAGRLGRRR